MLARENSKTRLSVCGQAQAEARVAQQERAPEGKPRETGEGYLVHLVYLVQPNKRDRPNRPNEQGRLAGFFSTLLSGGIP
jgi:hypothetical protein